MDTLFLALTVPDIVAEALNAVYRHYGTVIETTIPRAKLHLTLLWLGAADKPEALLAELTKPLPQSFLPTVRLTHVGRGRMRRQLWAWGEAAGPIMAIRAQLVERLEKLAWPLPKQGPRHPFMPHITVATVYDQLSHVGVADYPFVTSYAVQEVMLYMSVQQAGKPNTYSVVAPISLV